MKLIVEGGLFFFLIFTGCFEKSEQVIPFNQSESIQSKLVKEASSHLGKPYKYGKTGPKSFDCSGFVYAVHRNVGLKIPRTSLAQSKISGDKISKKNLEIGDLVFFDTSKKGHVNHSGIYIGKGKFIHASSGKAFSVTISDINAWYKDKFKWGKRIHANQ